MAISEKEVTRCANLLPPDVWLSSKELDDLWQVSKLRRKAIIGQLVARKLLERKGNTTTIRYRLIGTTKNEKKTNGLDDLIVAAARVGEENESLKQTLRTIDAAIAKVRELL